MHEKARKKHSNLERLRSKGQENWERELTPHLMASPKFLLCEVLCTSLGSEDRAFFRGMFPKVQDRTSLNNTIRHLSSHSFNVSDLAGKTHSAAVTGLALNSRLLSPTVVLNVAQQFYIALLHSLETSCLSSVLTHSFLLFLPISLRKHTIKRPSLSPHSTYSSQYAFNHHAPHYEK